MKCLIIAVFTDLIANIFCDTPANNITAKYDAAELLRKIFNTNDTVLARANYGLVQFEGQTPQSGYVNFETQNYLEDNRGNGYTNEASVKFENQYEPTYNTYAQNVVKFEETTKNGSKKKKRRKRKPKQHFGQQNPGNVPNPVYYGNGPGHYPYYGGQYRPLGQHPRPSIASEALSAVTEALTSIALYDDYQCVSRLLCEAAAGGTLGSSGLLQTVSGLQPLLTLLSAYSGLTTNPLFVFGRAVLLGAASNSNPATCRYAYSACPTDPEQLVYYLNNYNGGFFRFFNAPQQGQQNIQQFYDQLSLNYGLYQPNQDYNQHNNQQNFGFNNNQQNYGFTNPNLYSNYKQNYGLAYPYQNNAQNIRFKNHDDFIENMDKIEKRIQIKPNTLYIDDLEDGNPRWVFPEGNRNPINYVNSDAFNLGYSSVNSNFDSQIISHNEQNDGNQYHNGNRKGKFLRFPGANNQEDYLDSNHDENRGPFFPEHQNNKQYFDNNTPSKNYDSIYYDNRQYLDYNTPTKNNDYDTNYYNYNTQNSDYDPPTKNSNNYNSNYHNNKQYSDYNSASNNKYYANRDEYYADQYYANKNKYDNYNHANRDKYNNYYNNDNNANKDKYNNNYNNDNYGNRNKYTYNNNLEDGVHTVYVVRGNGDPRRPEIHRLRPGQTVH